MHDTTQWNYVRKCRKVDNISTPQWVARWQIPLIVMKKVKRWMSRWIMGDFNHADIRWNCLDSCDDGKAFFMLVQDCFPTQHVSEPTRGDNILDLILSTQKELIDNVRAIEPLGTSDHSQIQFNFLRVKTVNKGTKQKRRDFQKGDYDRMRQYAQNKKWKLLLKKETRAMLDNFKARI